MKVKKILQNRQKAQQEVSLMSQQLSIGILVERRYLNQAQPAGLSTALRARGHKVTLIDPETISCELGNDGWLNDFDLIVGRGRSLTLLCLLAQAERRGKLTLNRRAAIAAVHNKADMAATLTTNNIPTPQTLLGQVERLASQVPLTSYPLILKPVFGDNSRGLRVVHSPAELAELSWPEPVALAQPYLPNDGYDLKLYGIGNEVWAVRKPSPFNMSGKSSISSAELLPLTPALRDLGRRCGKLFGLELYGVDCLQTSAGVAVIEVNDFPTYTGVPEADKKLADYIIQKTQRRCNYENWNDYGATSRYSKKSRYARSGAAALRMGSRGGTYLS
jgi:glutathione synthase/RimK-type ligase-like ATP-grasp enzyme